MGTIPNWNRRESRLGPAESSMRKTTTFMKIIPTVMNGKVPEGFRSRIGIIWSYTFVNVVFSLCILFYSISLKIYLADNILRIFVIN